MKQLIYGIEHDGKLHRDFTLRVPTIGDNIDAVTDAAGGNDLAVNVALLARCLAALGEIPQEIITFDWLRSRLVDDDYDVLWAELAEVKKKRRAQKSDCGPSAASS